METITKIFTNNEDIPLQICVPIKVPIDDFETENMKVTNCYTTGCSVPYLAREIEYGLENLIFVCYRREK